MNLKEDRQRTVSDMLPENLKVAHVFVNSFRYTSRTIKEMRSIRKVSEAHVSFVGMKDNDLPSYELFDGQFEIFREIVKTRSLPKYKFFQLIKYGEWAWKAFSRLKKLTPTLIHCHGLWALPVAVSVKYYLKCALVYDAHELETERQVGRTLQRYLMYRLEKFLIKSVDEVLVVSPSIKEFYQKLYPKKKINLLVNAPSNLEIHHTQSLDIRKFLGLSDKDFIFLYMGGMSKERGIELYLEVFKELDPPFHLFFLGNNGPLCKDIQKIARKQENIHWHSLVPHDQVINTIKSADVVLRMFKTTHLNHVYAMPNSIFQAEVAGIPYLINRNCKDITDFFSSSPLCIPIDYDANELYRWCKNYTHESFPKRTKKVNDIYTWEAYEQRLFDSYKNALNKTSNLSRRKGI